MNFKKNGGFTLVELIVVIAIMAILAGVAVPVYSGYIAKAEKAADLQLLGAVNSAFAASVVENGGDPRQLSSATATITSGKITAVNANNAKGNLNVQESFNRYFAGNESSAFKSITQLLFIKADGVFVDPTSTSAGISSIEYAGGTLYFTNEQLQAVIDSTFNTKLGVADLMNQVDSVAGLAAGFGNGYVNQLMASPEFTKSMIQYLGGNPNATDLQTELVNVATNMINSELEKQGYNLTDPTADNYLDPTSDAYYDKFAAVNDTVTKNALVLYTAQNASGQSAGNVMNIINSDNPKQALTEYMKNTETAGEGFGNAALLYGTFTAYANATNNSTALGAVNNSTDPTAVFDLLVENEAERVKFQEYMNKNPQGQKDLEACLAAMEMVNNSSTNKDALSDVLVNGYNNEELVGLLGGLLNSNSES